MMKPCMSHRLLTLAVSLYLASWVSHGKAAGQCKAGGTTFGKALTGHMFEKFKADRPTDCVIRCENEPKCQSFNYVIEEKICELNNRTKEARPEDYVTDPARIYMTVQHKRVPLGSIPEFPAESCEEIKASEGEAALCKNWLKPNSTADTTLTHCYLETRVYRMIFPPASIQNYALKANAIKNNLAAFTLCLFVKLAHPQPIGLQHVYSYAASSSRYGNGILIVLFNPDIQISVDAVTRNVGNKIEDVKWHHICMAWDNTEGSYEFYMDGQITDSGTGLQKNHVIPSGGTTVLGQDQDSVGGGFEADQEFGPGQLAEVNMWSRVLSGSEIAAQYQDCHIPQGSVHAWAQFKDAINGAVKVEEP